MSALPATMASTASERASGDHEPTLTEAPSNVVTRRRLRFVAVGDPDLLIAAAVGRERHLSPVRRESPGPSMRVASQNGASSDCPGRHRDLEIDQAKSDVWLAIPERETEGVVGAFT